MGVRTVAREAALMMLFSAESQETTAPVVVKDFFASLALGSELVLDADSRAYAEDVVGRVLGSRDSIDATIRAASTNWRLERMSRVDRNVLRLATAELLSGIERAIAIDEAVELAKRFGTTESSAFVNGVLSHVADLLEKKKA